MVMAKTPRGIAVRPVRAHYTRRGKYVKSYIEHRADLDVH
jgi:hypothetical protein